MAADEQLPTADLLIPQNEGDYSNLLASLMDQQHKILTSTLGVDHPQVALASTLVDLQSTVRILPPVHSHLNSLLGRQLCLLA